MSLNNEIVQFYRQYQERIKCIYELEDKLLKNVNDEEVWKGLLVSKTELVHDSFIKNTAQYNSLIQPFVDDPSTLTFEIIDVLLREIYSFTLTHLYDQLLTSNVLYAILTYLRTYEYCVHREIVCMHLLGIHLEHLNNEKYIKEAAGYFHEIAKHSDMIYTAHPYVRNCIGKSFYNYIMREMDYPESADLNEIIRVAIHSQQFYNNENVLKALDGIMDCSMFSKMIMQYLIVKIHHFKYRTEPELYNYVYQEYQLAVNTIETMIHEIKPLNALEFSAYYHNRYLMKELSTEEYIRKCYEYITTIAKPKAQLETETYLHSDYFVSMQTVGTKLIEALGTLPVLNDEQTNIKVKTLSIMNDVISNIPRINEMRSFTDRVVYDTLKVILPHLSVSEVKSWIIRFAIIRQTSTAIHSLMVAELTCLVFEYLYDHHNEILEHSYNISKDDILLFIYDCGLFHDIGKTRISNIIKCDYRRLTNEEFAVIKEHPTLGADLAHNSSYLMKYEMMIKGHHKFYNNQGGYPDDFSRDDHHMLIVRDILTICDSLDSATDMYGRDYHEAKAIKEVFNEFAADNGVRYNPKLIKCILEDTDLVQLLSNKCTQEERYRVIRDVYLGTHN